LAFASTQKGMLHPQYPSISARIEWAKRYLQILSMNLDHWAHQNNANKWFRGHFLIFSMHYYSAHILQYCDYLQGKQPFTFFAHLSSGFFFAQFGPL